MTPPTPIQAPMNAIQNSANPLPRVGSSTELRSVAVLMNNTKVRTRDRNVPMTSAKKSVLSKGVVRILCPDQLGFVFKGNTDPLTALADSCNLLCRTRTIDGRSTASHTCCYAWFPPMTAVEFRCVRSTGGGLREKSGDF